MLHISVKTINYHVAYAIDSIAKKKKRLSQENNLKKFISDLDIFFENCVYINRTTIFEKKYEHRNAR